MRMGDGPILLCPFPFLDPSWLPTWLECEQQQQLWLLPFSSSLPLWQQPLVLSVSLAPCFNFSKNHIMFISVPKI